MADEPRSRGWWHPQARSLHARGKSIKEISEIIGVSGGAVRFALMTPAQREHKRQNVQRWREANPGYDLRHAEFQPAQNVGITLPHISFLEGDDA